jgi:hypothetical protein
MPADSQHFKIDQTDALRLLGLMRIDRAAQPLRRGGPRTERLFGLLARRCRACRSRYIGSVDQITNPEPARPRSPNPLRPERSQ